MPLQARALIGGMRSEQQHQCGGAEENQGRELILARKRHVGNQDDRHEQNAVDGAVVPIDAVRCGLGGPPDDDADDQAEVPVLGSGDLVAPGQVEVGLGNGVRGRLEPPDKARRRLRRQGDHRAYDLYQHEGPDYRARDLGDPWRDVQAGADIAPESSRNPNPDDEARQVVPPEDPASVGDRPGRRACHHQYQNHAQPTLVRA